MPLAEFRRRRRDAESRQRDCNACHAAEERARRLHARTRTLGRFAYQVRTETNWVRVSALCAGIVRRFGGLDHFCTLWKESLDSACRVRPGSRMVLDSFRAIIRMIELCDANRPPQPDFGAATDEELVAAVLAFAETRREVS